MIEVYCSAVDCRHHGNKGLCTAKSIRLDDVPEEQKDLEGRRVRCQMFVESGEYAGIRKWINKHPVKVRK